ncbi:MAG TPA: hypothetical protein VM695_10310 [Phycisphaerae bacterium]|nr:hypothetical protein [Phycisphaerae bacterium]
MKYWAMGLLSLGVALAGVMVGCESDQPPEEVSQFDPNIDAPPTNLLVSPDPALLADQAKLADVQAREAATVTGSAGATTRPGPGAPADPNVASVRGIMEKLIDGAKAGQMSAVLGYLNDADKAELTEAFTALGQVAAGAAELDTVLKQKMDANDIPASLEQTLSYGAGAPVLATLANLDLDMLEYKLDAGAMVVSGGNAPLRFAKAGDAWQLQLTAADKKVYAAVGALGQQQIQFIQGLSEGLRTGGITRINIAQEVMTRFGDTVKPAMDRLKEAIDSASGGGAP